MHLPIVRWTIGNVSNHGLSCLKLSVKTFKLFYGNNFRFIICYNNIDPSRLKISNVEFIEQKTTLFKGNGSIWKYSPARIDLFTPELYIDNDVVFTNTNQKILNFFKDKHFLLCSDYMPWYGKYNKYFNVNERYNAGLFGIPSFYDFEIELKKNWHLMNSLSFLTSAEEQGLTAFTIKKHSPIVLGLDEAMIAHSNGKIVIDTVNPWEIFCFESLFKKPDILHFVGLNRKKTHYFYDLFRKKLL